MYKISIIRDLHKRDEDTELRFRLKDTPNIDLVYNTGVRVRMGDLAAFTLNGELRPSENGYDQDLKDMIDRCRAAIGEAYTTMVQDGYVPSSEIFQAAVGTLLRKEDEVDEPADPDQSLVERYRCYIEEEHRGGVITDKMYRENMTLSRKLERFLIVRELEGIVPVAFTTEMLTDFEKFCVDEYLYAANPKYAHLYPRGYDECRFWPKQRLKEEPLRKVLIHFQVFWRDLVSFGELEVSPYDAYVPWMEEKKRKRYSELLGEPLTLTMEEFQQVVSTPVPERLAQTRNAFILQCCLGCRGEDFRELTLKNVEVSKEGIPYIIYTHKAIRKKEKKEYCYEVKVPLVRIAFDIVMRTRFDFFLGVYNASYNMKLQQFLRHCGITREVCVENLRTNEVEIVPFCDVVTQGIIHRMHMDLLYESDGLRGLRGGFYNGVKKMTRYNRLPLKDYFKKLNKALGQMPFKVDQNFNIVEGSPFVKQDVFVYREQPDKLPGGRTNPYIITELQPLPSGEGPLNDRVEVKYGPMLLQERKVAVCGKQFLGFLDSLEEGARQWIQYGLMLLKKLPDFKLPFVRDLGDTLYELRTVYRWHKYSSIFYLNGSTIVLLHGTIEKRRMRRSVADGMLDKLMDMRWKNIVGELPSVEYETVLDEQFGVSGSVRREVWEMRACSSYVSQTISQARSNAGLMIKDIADYLGLKPNTTRLNHVEDGFRVLPFRYLCRILDAMGMKAIVTRPSLLGWNDYSLTHTLEQMLIEIGEPVYRWHRKGSDD